MLVCQTEALPRHTTGSVLRILGALGKHCRISGCSGLQRTRRPADANTEYSVYPPLISNTVEILSFIV